MTEPKYKEGDEFDLGADGHVEITEVYAVREDEDKVVYTVKYLDQVSNPESTLGEDVLEEVN